MRPFEHVAILDKVYGIPGIEFSQICGDVIFVFGNWIKVVLYLCILIWNKMVFGLKENLCFYRNGCMLNRKLFEKKKQQKKIGTYEKRSNRKNDAVEQPNRVAWEPITIFWTVAEPITLLRVQGHLRSLG